MHDLIIRGGKVVDGTGAAARTADVAISEGRIAEIGRVTGPSRETVDADGALVTPGFVDVHTHYDGQFLWDDTVDPSFSHGVTTAIAGNCGVGFAPLRAEFRNELIELMEGVEDIPGIVLDEGLDWDWRSFGDYLDRLDARHYTMDVASQITHAPLRVAVMGERALKHESATAEDIAAMGELVRDAMRDGAIGFSASRILEHTSSNGAKVPGTFAADDELMGLARAMGESGHGVFQMIPLGAAGGLVSDGIGRDARKAEHDRMGRIAGVSGRPVTYLLIQMPSDRDDWHMMLGESERHTAGGRPIHPQIASRPIGMLAMIDGRHPFRFRPAYLEVADLPLAQRVAALRDPQRRAAILSQADDESGTGPVNERILARLFQQRAGKMYVLSAPIDYEPGEESRIDTLAARVGCSPEAFLYDHLTAGDGSNLAADIQLNYIDGNLDVMQQMLKHPLVISGLGDGGAHLPVICDASMTTSQLTFWGRDRTRGPRLPIETVVAKMTGANAGLYGLRDRGILAAGRRADINVIDFENLALDLPRIRHDLPTGGPRLLQKSQGYLATLVNGVITRRNDADTGARPGRLMRAGRG